MAELSTESLPFTPWDWDYNDEYNNTECPKFDAPEMTITSITLIICLLGLMGNGIVVWFLGFQMKRNPFTVYILNLAVADTSFLLCSVVYLVAYVVLSWFCVSLKAFYMLVLFSVLCIWAYSTSLYLLTAISTERCVSVLYPIWHRCRRPKCLSAIVSALLWALSCLMCCSIGIACLGLSEESCITSLFPISVLNILIFTPIMVLSSLTLFIKVRRSSQRRPPGKLYAVILLTVLFFLLLTLPLSIDLFLSYQEIVESTDILHVLSCASSSINPFIYFLVGSNKKRQFCGSFKLALQRAFGDQTDSREDRDTSPGTDATEMAV